MWWNDYFEYQWANFLRLSVNIAPATVCSTNCECMFVFLEHFFLLTEVKNYIRNSLAENSQSEYLNLNICYFVANQRFANHCQTLQVRRYYEKHTQRMGSPLVTKWLIVGYCRFPGDDLEPWRRTNLTPGNRPGGLLPQFIELPSRLLVLGQLLWIFGTTFRQFWAIFGTTLRQH